jgi:regulatory protein YycI of two-component signal transduction system YycFG
MAEVFEGQLIDWNKFTAKDAAKYTKEGQERIQKKEYIDIIQEIAYVATSGQSEITLTKKLTDFTVSKLEANGFNISCQKKDCYTITSTSGEVEECMLYTTTIKW